MSDFTLYEILNLVRQEIQKAQLGNVKKIIGPAGEKGEKGEVGGQGIQGPKGDKGAKGDRGLKGDKGPAGQDGKDGEDGTDGVGIDRIEQGTDNEIIMYLTDGSSYIVEMPLGEDGEVRSEVHYKSIGGGGGGTVDLSGYVRRPGANLRDGRWLAYRETTDDKREWSPLTTDMIETNGMIMFRDINGRFAPTPEELDELTNQLKVNRFIWEKIQELDLKAGGVAISEDPPKDPDNGMFWFDNSEDVMQLYIWHKDSDAWVPVAPPTTLEGRVATGEATQQAIIEQIQESLVEQQQIKNKVAALEGAVGEHSFVFDSISQNPRAGEFILKDAGNRNTNYLSEGGIIAFSETDREDFPVDWSKINTGDVIRISSVDKQIGELRIVAKAATSAFIYEYLGGDLDRLSELPYDCLLMSAFDPAGLAQIDYVDARDKTKIGRRAIWTLENDTPWILRQNNLADQQRQFIKIHDGTMNLENVATPGDDGDAVNKAYVDQEIAKAIANIKAPEPEPRPAQFSWKYAGTTNGAHPPQYYFYTQGDDVLLSLISNNGLKITSDVEKSWRAAGDGAFEMSFWIHKGGNEWKLFKHCEIEKVYWQDKDNWNTNCLRFRKKWENNKNSFTSQHEYWITVGGFF